VQYSISDAHNTIILSNTKSTNITPTAPGLSYIFTKNANIQIILNELATKTHVEVISSPKLFVLNNQTATLQVGNRVPIATQQAVSTVTTGAPVVNSIEYQDTGVILKVTPRVNRGGLVMMDVSQEVSDVVPNTTSGIDSPTIEERKINSSVAVQDGETVALGGLIQDTVSKDKSGIPLIMDIPVIGGLFAQTQKNVGRTELMVLITPHVVDSREKARAITEELRNKLPTLQSVYDRGN
jgi:general secretion pathway protein D